MKDNTKVIVALLAGLAAGAALGILFAPDKGTETRDKLSDALKNLGDSIKDRAAEEIDHLAELKDKVIGGFRSKTATPEEEFNGATDQV
ncbi:YtxH domain-containing protein [Hufsiella ginkgonis]|uniref:YtxH domain-containing protein n=1 Tax=Hufsiella ginkgonis TaxID=2695274 RepID=A0A7K1XT49_9SPHI|nr:YtxH domain-containing protein [Hufsiella ginkgonis]MXV14134.1 YtxH domain-containing protein [Hufsiella ginkgonis]